MISFGAVLALAADRMLNSDPAGAVASAIRRSTIGGDAGPAVDEAVNGEAPSEHHALFPRNIPDMSWSDALRNPFAWPDKLQKLRRSRLQGSADKPEAVVNIRKPGEPLTIAQFLSAHEVTGLFVDDPAAVIIDGTLIEVGQKFDESTLLRVGTDAAYFQCLDGIAEVRVTSRDF